MNISELKEPTLYTADKIITAGSIIIYDGVVYECLKDALNKNPPDYIGDYWKFVYVDRKMKPWITGNPSNIYVITNSTIDIILNGFYLEDTLSVEYPADIDITVNSINVISPEKMIINITVGNIDVSSGDITTLMLLNREYIGIMPNTVICDVVHGNGPSGTFITDFNTSNTGDTLWPNWALQVFGNITDTASFYKSGTSTPSSGTGATSSSSGFDGNFGFCETSNPNNGTGQYGTAETDYFNVLDSIQFSYHMFGGNMGDLILESQNIDNTWTERLTISGQQQSAQDDAFIDTGTIDASGWAAKKLRFTFTNITGYQSDFCYDNITIISHS